MSEPLADAVQPDYSHVSRAERIRRASLAYHAGTPCDDNEAMEWLEELFIEIEMIGLFNGSIQAYRALDGPFVDQVRAVVIGRREAERVAKAKETAHRDTTEDQG
jgi:hypothetical protein